MSEKLGNYTNYIDSIDVKKDKIDNGINEDRIKSEARKYVESRIKEGINKTELQELLKDIKQLLERQDIERINLKETLEKEIKKDTKEKLDKEKLVHEAKNTIYEKLGISNNIKSNNPVENFEKGIIDVLIVGNYDLAIEIYNTNGKVLIDALKQLASWEGIKQIAESLKESVIGLFNGNAYDKGKSFAELGLVGTGAFAGLKIAKFGVKGLKHVPKNIPSENIVYNPIIKHTVKETKSKIDGIIPKQELNFEKMIVEDIAKLGDKERVEAGSFYLKKKLDKNQENAIIEAHEVGKDRPGAGVHNYTQEEILQKVRILKDAGFSKEERKVLLEKGVCGKEKGINEDLLIKELQSRKEKKEYYTKLDRLGLTEDFIQSIEKSGIWGSEKLGIVERYERINKQINDYFNKQVKGEIKKEDYIDFKDFNEFINKGLDEINSKITNGPKLTKTEANLIFSLTDNFLFNNLNTFLGGKGDRYEKLINLLKNKGGTEGVEKLVNEIDIALSKMPDLKPGEGGFILRGDKIEFWKNDKGDILEIGDTNELKIFSFCANNESDTFIGKFGKDTAVYVIGKEGRIKDISKLSLGVNFGGRVIQNIDRTYNEGIILRNSTLYVDDKEIIGNTYRFDTIQTK